MYIHDATLGWTQHQFASLVSPFPSIRTLRAESQLLVECVHFVYNHHTASNELTDWNSLLAGFWETLTYGLFGMYKSDWKVFGGFNTRKYTHKWGGEDWDLVDKWASNSVWRTSLIPRLPHSLGMRLGWDLNNKSSHQASYKLHSSLSLPPPLLFFILTLTVLDRSRWCT